MLVISLDYELLDVKTKEDNVPPQRIIIKKCVFELAGVSIGSQLAFSLVTELSKKITSPQKSPHAVFFIAGLARQQIRDTR